MFPVILDIVVGFLLLITISYAWKLNRRIAIIQKSKQDLNQFLTEFNHAIERADHNIEQLKLMSQETDSQLIEQINKARYLANDLSFLMEKGESVADALEHYITTSRDIRKSGANAQPPAKKTQGSQTSVSHITNKRYMEEETARKKENISPEWLKEETNRSSLSESKKLALNEVLDQIAKRKADAYKPSSAPPSEPKAQTQSQNKNAFVPFSNARAHSKEASDRLSRHAELTKRPRLSKPIDT